MLQREPEALTIRLPFGSREGAYEVQIQKSAGHPLLSATGEAKVENGTTALTAKMDLSKFESRELLYLSSPTALGLDLLPSGHPLRQRGMQHGRR